MHCFQMVLILSLLLLTGCAAAEPPPTAIAPAPPVHPASTTAASPASTGAPGLNDSLYPAFGNGGYEVRHYALNLSIADVEANEIKGLATLSARSLQNLNRFNLDFIGFSIDALTVNAQPASFTRSGQELTITPAQPIPAGQDFQVEVTYHGIPEEIDSVAAPGRIGWIHDDDISYVLSEPDGAATFFPVNDHPLDKATYTFSIQVPRPYAAAANGILAGSQPAGDTVTYVWEQKQGMASYLALIAIDEFVIENQTSPNGVPIRNYYSAGLDEEARRPFARQGEMLAFFSDTFGPYPFDAYGALVLDTTVGTALEAQTLSLYGIDQLDLDDLPLAEQLAAHELAHQWFGDSLSVADWGDIWLNEGFATYAEGLWIEHTEGADALDTWVEDLLAYAQEYGDDMLPPGKPSADDLFNEGVYCRGGLTLHALRLQVGDRVFFDILKAYYDRFKGSQARTADFIAVAQEVSGRDLAAFFQAWLYQPELPYLPGFE